MKPPLDRENKCSKHSTIIVRKFTVKISNENMVFTNDLAWHIK